ncbi:CubicO group peptidase (beta-lactamase class C family) [Stackebrandtia endophytica]|uniref:CubicO group peptidase (Beta-lactamase class C family) n=1 Tax=Stackebrandtia endophytica TaxID=1496996 RepID=A0A543AQ40_9ACTN|nr:serine hydrolase domain-containing protein [Stackebrandtia endophytica]TQL74656.1 CubicO group peptidase (beta-lactamase class C family) [Stackebrandtia endophytica]
MSIVTAIALPLLLVNASAATAESTEEEVITAVEARLAETATPGAALALIGPEGHRRIETFGVDGNGVPVTADTPFLWGSVAKPVTASLILRLVDRGADLALSDRVEAHLPWFSPTLAGNPTQITVEQLLTHTAGLPSPQSGSVTDREDASPDAVTTRARELADVELLTEPGTSYRYSSVDYLLLGAIVEAVTGRPFSEALRHELAVPLGMNDIITDHQTADAKLPPGHRLFLGQALPHRVDYDNSGVPYGYLGGSVDDLATFALAHLTGEVASAALLDRAHRSQTDSTGGSYGYGWSIGTVADSSTPMVWHSGAVPGYQSVVILLPESQRALVLTQNTFGLYRDLQLLNAAFDAAALLANVAPPVGHGLDWSYVIIIGSALVIALAFGAATLVGPRAKPFRPRHVIWPLVTAVGTTVSCLVVLPAAAGVSLSFLALWLPDAWLALWLLSTASLAWATRRILARWRHRGSSPSRSNGSGHSGSIHSGSSSSQVVSVTANDRT